jgi:hypothetical protein
LQGAEVDNLERAEAALELIGSLVG